MNLPYLHPNDTVISSLQDLVRLRWDELSPSEHMDICGASFELMSEVANPCEECAMKTETVALVAEVRAGFSFYLTSAISIYGCLISTYTEFSSRYLKGKIRRCGRSCFSH